MTYKHLANLRNAVNITQSYLNGNTTAIFVQTSINAFNAYIDAQPTEPADAIEVEVERLKEANSKFASSDLLQSYEATQAENAKLRAQLAAAQGQEPVGFIKSAIRNFDGFHACFSSNVFIPAGTQLFAAPIPQQPSVPECWKLVPIELTHEQLVAMSNSQAVDDESVFPTLLDLIDYSGENKTRAVMRAAYAAVLAAAPQPKETK